ncbi:thymidylate synthase (FAD) [Geoalkalibacter ferrihydriticus]|uniref:Flavin-dependent thymidylate synthase n=2 Tax=Geoalkalibacter ferrihydriticus TaxID=392333 RepID=A0A0C2HG77_9BACT|nr:FAD-dependent thymidylate synthase [Geoalkalibacter ferrihydriticus]KIH75941.1 FAD-dependent thymidylate synthase [Geoalkalibacter ferrihydriticus DSM 17813]SDM56319.1 thymidylate synthase (FAD) [Geoalkalibacter ferrihydriticus]
MRVSLLTHTPDPERTVAAAARLCYSDSSIGELMDRSGSDRAAFLRKILSLGHFSVLEHASFTFGIEGISRACSHQLVRHRIASYSQQSQRYVSHRERFDAVTPPSIAAQPELLQRYETLLHQIHETYRDFLNAGIAAEDARFVLPNAAATKLVMTMNARELRHFFELRCCRRAQWEIRAMAVDMLRLCRKAASLLFADAGPGCLAGRCPEGAMTCGEMAQVREEFSQLG